MAELPEMKFKVLYLKDGGIRKMISQELWKKQIFPNQILSPEEFKAFPFGTSTGDTKSPDKAISMEVPEINNLEKAFTFVQNLPELYQAFLYKALHLNDMRIDQAENMIAKFKP